MSKTLGSESRDSLNESKVRKDGGYRSDEINCECIYDVKLLATVALEYLFLI